MSGIHDPAIHQGRLEYNIECEKCWEPECTHDKFEAANEGWSLRQTSENIEDSEQMLARKTKYLADRDAIDAMADGEKEEMQGKG